MTTRDAMEFINEQDEATLERFVERLEFRGRDPKFVGYRDAYVAKMALAPIAHVLDLGCGTGVVARALAAGEGFSGRVTGIEQSPASGGWVRRTGVRGGLVAPRGLRGSWDRVVVALVALRRRRWGVLVGGGGRARRAEMRIGLRRGARSAVRRRRGARGGG